MLSQKQEGTAEEEPPCLSRWCPVCGIQFQPVYTFDTHTTSSAKARGTKHNCYPHFSGQPDGVPSAFYDKAPLFVWKVLSERSGDCKVKKRHRLTISVIPRSKEREKSEVVCAGVPVFWAERGHQGNLGGGRH